MEDDETEDDKVPDIPSPPTPSKPRLMTDGTVPPKRRSLIVEMDNEENNINMIGDEEQKENKNHSCPNPPTPLRTRPNPPKFVNHVIWYDNGGVDTEHYYSDVDPDEEEEEEAEDFKIFFIRFCSH